MSCCTTLATGTIMDAIFARYEYRVPGSSGSHITSVCRPQNERKGLHPHITLYMKTFGCRGDPIPSQSC